MKTRHVLGTIVVLLALVMSQVQVASAATKYKIQNKTGVKVTITLSGPKYYTFQLKPGANPVEVEKGTYWYSYVACGKTNTGTVIFKSPSEAFELPKCGATATTGSGTTAVAGTIQVKINNKTGAKVRITLNGPKYYWFDLLSGMNKLQVLKGTYTYSYVACGKTNTGTFKANVQNAELILEKCPAAGGGEEKSAKTIKIKIKNDTGGGLTLYLYGPANYVFTIGTGNSFIYVEKGQYSYTVYSICGSLSGSKKLAPGYEWLWWCQ